MIGMVARQPGQPATFKSRIIAAFMTIICAACTPSERDMSQTGAGSDLMSSQTVVATDSLNAYFGEMCAQAGGDISGARPYHCEVDPNDENAWQSLVKTGMNDIDHRCDLYLSWLENKRNEKPFVDASLSSIGTATAGVLAVAAPGSVALSYVAVALGFASSTYNAYYNRVLLGIEPSTIKLTVESRRLGFRTQFLDARYHDRADVVYALRSYLKICTPQTIVMDVNSFARAAATGDEPPQVANLVLERNALDTVRVPTGAAMIPRRQAPPTPTQVGEIFSGNGYTNAQLDLLRRKLCVRPPDLNNSKTKYAVAMWEQGVYGGAASSDDGHNGLIDDLEWSGSGKRKGLREIPDCESRWRNPTERSLFQGNAVAEATFITALGNTVGIQAVNSLDDQAARDAVAAVRKSCNLPATTGSRNSDVTNDLFQKILAWAKKPKGAACD
ncbi:hypothetical protein ELI36_19050 [Rhizobium ruizarguesonis]|uniref:hypothetical protein n=1 Tax=Rhizobium ruizarguesonis TaxID=2081791 RepID=UPI00102FFD5C|nr:hypothetical protein [Rhizobium ruizarguesonis]TAV34380.1 hypothetical protein ELI36_19050 [Rhizobium ruizarguesonis]